MLPSSSASALSAETAWRGSTGRPRFHSITRGGRKACNRRSKLRSGGLVKPSPQTEADCGPSRTSQGATAHQSSTGADARPASLT